jgi:hypothetical protein
MIQEKIDNIDNDNTEIPLSLVDLILQDPVYTFLIGIILGLILSYVLRKLFSIKNTLPNVELKKEPIETEGNFGDLFQNLSNSDKCKDLYKSLIIKVHPDKFLGTDKEEKVLELAQELGKYKLNYMKLKEIEKVISDEFK